jgi:hypothetical protein
MFNHIKDSVKNRLLFPVVLGLAVLFAACSQTALPDPESSFIQSNAANDSAEPTYSDTGVIAEIARDGRTYTFIDEGQFIDGGGVGILEVTSDGQPSLLATLDTISPTALEVFFAIAPNETAPGVLYQNHNQLTQAVPRQLELTELETSHTVGSLSCSSPENFQASFKFWFANNYKYEGYGLNLWGNNTGVTGVADRRALAACNRNTPYSFATVKVRVEAQIAQNLWVAIPASIMELSSTQGMYYLSQGWTAQRYRISARGHHYTEYHLAGAWGKK